MRFASLTGRHRVDRGLQPRHHLDVKRNVCLLSSHRHLSVVDVLTSHSHDVGARPPGLQQQLIGKSCARAERMIRLELLALPCFPRMMTFGLHLR